MTRVMKEKRMVMLRAMETFAAVESMAWEGRGSKDVDVVVGLAVDVYVVVVGSGSDTPVVIGDVVSSGVEAAGVGDEDGVGMGTDEVVGSSGIGVLEAVVGCCAIVVVLSPSPIPSTSTPMPAQIPLITFSASVLSLWLHVPSRHDPTTTNIFPRLELQWQLRSVSAGHTSDVVRVVM
jgi:hypothetical protein